MQPSQATYSTAQFPFGWVALAVRQGRVCSLTLGDTQHAALVALKCQKDQLVEDKVGLRPLLQTLSTPELLGIELVGTPFQKKVWQQLRHIPKGQVATYTEVARALKCESSVRAVANACGANKIALIIPCHRVIGSNGALSGYRWGTQIKRSLLEYEGVSI